jgi:hypothetical protein
MPSASLLWHLTRKWRSSLAGTMKWNLQTLNLKDTNPQMISQTQLRPLFQPAVCLSIGCKLLISAHWPRNCETVPLCCLEC